MTKLEAQHVWDVIDKQQFAVLGMVTLQHAARTVGIVYIIDKHRLYISSHKDAWKVRHIAQNPNVSLTVPISKRIPFLPFIKIPAATVTFSAEARILKSADVSLRIRKRLYRQRADDQQLLAETAIIEVMPHGEFLTYGIGMPVWQMADTKKARGRVSVATRAS